MKSLLMHSLSEFDEILLELARRLAPRSILEIGSESGAFTKRLYEHCRATSAELLTVEPSPAPAIVELASSSTMFHLFVDKSHLHLFEHGCRADLVFIDGDHNWWTVYGELALIARSWTERGSFGTIVLHDVGWPCARRDAYYDPKAIPSSALHPHTWKGGVRPDDPGIVEGGFRGEGAFAWATMEGGPCNGVLTAVEDFMADNPGWTFQSIDAVFGLGLLTRAGSRDEAIVRELVAPYQNALVSRLERNRLDNYLRVIELQDELARARQRRETVCPAGLARVAP
jgi:hypothetical protein